MLKLEHIPAIASTLGVAWTSRWIGFAVAVFFGAAFLGIVPLLGLSGLRSGVLLFSIGAISGYLIWLLSCRIPKNKPGMIGVALAIKAETPEEHRRIRSDFIQEIAARLGKNGAVRPFYVFEIPGYLAPEVNDIEGASQFLGKSRCHLLIWGGIRTRTKARAKTYCLRLEGVVTHAIIEQERSQAFAKDMRLAIPEKTEISLANELRGFESTSQSISLGAQYVVAMAAAISGDWMFSQSLLIDLKETLEKSSSGKNRKTRTIKQPVDILQNLRKLVPLRLAEVSFAHFHSSLQEWQRNKSDKASLARAEEALEIYQKIQGKKEEPRYWINKAMLEVTRRQDIASAERLLNKCRSVAIHDPTWRLSLAFVDVLKGNITEALNLYDTALKKPVPVDMLMNIEDYVQWWLNVHNGPPALYLLSALLNARGKGDMRLALADLNSFEASAGMLDEAQLKRASTLRKELESR